MFRRVAALTQKINCLHIISEKKNQLLALKNITTDMGRIPLFSIITDNDNNVFYMQSGRSGQRE
jgi:hypothetical protein